MKINPIILIPRSQVYCLPQVLGSALVCAILLQCLLLCPAQAEAPVTSAPMISALLPGGVIYLRLSQFTPQPEISSQLVQWTQQGAIGLVLDLRDNDAPNDYDGAAQVAGFFIKSGTRLFEAKDAQGRFRAYSSPPSTLSFAKPLVVLINRQTCGASEALARSLRSQGALLVGASPQARSGDSHPVAPDIAIPVNNQAEKDALAVIERQGILDVIGESPGRHRLTEAALVQGQDPELDDYLSSCEKKPVLLSLPVVHDAVLVSALDSLKAIHLSQKTPTSISRADGTREASASLQ